MSSCFTNSFPWCWTNLQSPWSARAIFPARYEKNELSRRTCFTAGEAGGCCSIRCPSEIYRRLNSREISFAHLFIRGQIVLKYCTAHDSITARALRKFAKWFDNLWKNKISLNMSLSWVSDGYSVLQHPPGENKNYLLRNQCLEISRCFKKTNAIISGWYRDIFI